MSTHPVRSVSVDLQLGSGLFLAPIEIRRAIYVYLIPNGVHVFFRQGKIHLSVCVEPSPAGDHDGFDRKATGSDRQTLDDWFADVVDFMADMAVFNVTDLDTLGCLLQRAGTSFSETPSVSDYLTSVLPCIRRLDITLRLPLPICKALENPGADSSPGSSPADASTAGWASKLTVWLRLCPAIAQLKGLQGLRIWLDHDDPSSWSVSTSVLSYLPLRH